MSDTVFEENYFNARIVEIAKFDNKRNVYAEFRKGEEFYLANPNSFYIFHYIDSVFKRDKINTETYSELSNWIELNLTDYNKFCKESGVFTEKNHKGRIGLIEDAINIHKIYPVIKNSVEKYFIEHPEYEYCCIIISNKL